MQQRARRSPSPARRAAFLILRRIAEAPVDPAALLHSPLTAGLSPADVDLATELVYGTLRWQAALDFIAGTHARRSAQGIDFPLLLALRIGLYQLRHLTRVPQRAAVDESVKLAHAFARPAGARLVNAVLRSFCRRPDLAQLPTKNEDPVGYLSVTLSHPEWLARRYLGRLSLPRAEALCLRNNLPPPTDLRVEPPLDVDEARRLLAQESVLTEPLRLVPGALRVLSGKPQATSLHRAGAIHIQEGGSQLISRLLAPQASDRVLDACAAPGGKATALARAVPSGWVLAIDKSPQRLAVARSLAERLSLRNVRLLAADSGRLPLARSFPHVLLDAPCSNLGTLARNPDVKWRLREEDLVGYGARQRRLLHSLAGVTQPGGTLVYSTCSTEPEENDEVVRSFLAGHPEFQPGDPPPSFPGPARELFGGDGAFRTVPGQHPLDGYYAVVLCRRAPAG